MDIVCKNAIENLIKIPEIEPCFDYILIDESQDFPSSFFDLCELVVAKTIFTAGDIFQKITDDVPEMNSVSYLLNRCYRTDNRTLMFAHALGLGLFEKRHWTGLLILNGNYLDIQLYPKMSRIMI